MVAGAFHLVGVRASPGLLTAAGFAAAFAAGISMLRLRTGLPAGIAAPLG